MGNANISQSRRKHGGHFLPLHFSRKLSYITNTNVFRKKSHLCRKFLKFQSNLWLINVILLIKISYTEILIVLLMFLIDKNF